MDPDQVPAFPTRGSISLYVDLPTPRRTTTDVHSSRSEADLPAISAGGQLSQVPPLQHTSQLGSSSNIDAHFFFTPSVPTLPANSAGEEVLARSTAQDFVDWYARGQGRLYARTKPQDESRPHGGSTDTYEARALEIMQYIWNLSDNYDRLQEIALDMQPHPEDHYQRLNQLYTSIRSLVDELRHDCTQYTLVMGDWNVLMTEHFSPDNEWPRTMLQHNRTFFEDPAFTPKLLDEQQMDLLDHFYRLQRRIEDIIRERDGAAKATVCRNRPANSAGGDRTLSALEQQCASIRLGTQPTPADATDRQRSTETDAQRPRNVPGEPLPPPIRLGWTTARGGARHAPQRPTANSAAGTAPSPGLAANSAAGHLGGSGYRAATPPGPSQDRRKSMMTSFASSASDRENPVNAFAGPLQVGANGKRFSGSNADAKLLPPTREATDFDPHGGKRIAVTLLKQLVHMPAHTENAAEL